MSSQKDIDRAAKWNRDNAERRSAARRAKRAAQRREAQSQIDFWGQRKIDLIAERGEVRGLRRLEYEKHREKYIARAKKWVAENPDRRREINRTWAAEKRAKSPEDARKRGRESYARNSKAAKERSIVWASNNPPSTEWVKANRHKLEARSLAGIAKRCGEIDTSSCVDCGSTSEIQMHHEDYSRPLDVTPLCRACHYARHAVKRNKGRFA